MSTNLWGNVICAVDVETTGTLAGWHEIIQIACIPLDQHFEPHPKYKHFYLPGIMPDFPGRMDPEAERKHGISVESLEGCPSQEKASGLFVEWFERLELPFSKKLAPLAQNWAFEKSFLTHFLGQDGLNAHWHFHARDTMRVGAFINDLYVFNGRRHPFSRLGLGNLCSKFDIQLDDAHNALADCLATAKLYAEFLRFLGGA
jgi:DNA polymerase III epsilon subunit-like protein